MGDDTTELRAHPDVLIQKMPNGESVLLNMETEVYYGLDEVGTRIWDALAETGKVGDSVELLIDQFDVGRRQLEADVASLVQQLAEAGLIVKDD